MCAFYRSLSSQKPFNNDRPNNNNNNTLKQFCSIPCLVVAAFFKFLFVYKSINNNKLNNSQHTKILLAFFPSSSAFSSQLKIKAFQWNHILPLRWQTWQKRRRSPDRTAHITVEVRMILIWNYSWSRFHQHCTCSFYACRAQKCKKTVNSSSFLPFQDLRA